MNEDRDHAVIFFDGVCNLCNHSVQFIIKRDHKDYFRFAALQSDIATQKLSDFEFNAENLKTIILLENGQVYFRSTAALRIARQLGGGWPILFGLIIIPAVIRDFVYKLIANNRYRIWGKTESCMVPSPELKSKFL
ncbi:thiol-disulfide oxidoreductase [Pedobacter sp. KBW06]|uniref:thiol-disulfide oxidoreductase DCC family protein n=1 Tax=Pedobacter sp. KBW06 TaxID=2153359 RepID=UPI000F5B1A72|nr:DCC1-like thiol-disulfide oxidoreductase family protein [Pedobacter sp. KBW06]RQO70747.1 thiol-disulfide oxidoreductase [Pedobacter sp. KBW06]